MTGKRQDGISMKPVTDKVRLENAVQNIGKAFDVAVKAVENSSSLTKEQVDIAFRYVSHLLLTAHQKAALSVSIARAANGGFSLDDAAELPLPALPQANADRLVGQRHKEPPRISSLDDDVDFLDDDVANFV